MINKHNKYKVLDTNIILLNHLNILEQAENSVVVIPDTVLQEIDGFKGNMNELGFHARKFSKLLEEMEIMNKMSDGFTTQIHLKHHEKEADFLIFSKVKYYSTSSEEGYKDGRIIEIAELLEICSKDEKSNLYGSEVEFITQDANCKYRAIGKGINSYSLKTVEKIDYSFIKELEIEDAEIFRTLHNSNITIVDNDYKTEDYNYIFTNPITGQQKLAIIVDNQINVISKDAEKELRLKQPIPPLNREQLLFSKAIQDPRLDILVCDAKAGSGKTITAFSNAMRLIDMKEFKGILYLRNTINDEEPGEDIGYLSGNDEKMNLYTGSGYDAVNNIAASMLKKSKLKGPELQEAIDAKADELVISYNIQVDTTTGWRGRDVKDTFVIIDETQNCSDATGTKMLTRFGEGCKVIIIGSNNQIDNKYLNKFNNYLSTIINAASKQHKTVNMYGVKLNKVLRGPIVEFAEDIVRKKQGT